MNKPKTHFQNGGYLRCGLIVVGIIAGQILGATGQWTYTPLPDRGHFDQDIEIVSAIDPFQGHDNYRYEDYEFTLTIDTLEGDLVTWKFNDSVVKHGPDGFLRISSFDSAQAGNYRATISRDGLKVSTRPLVINLVGLTDQSVLDPTFSASRVAGLEAIPLGIRPDGSVVVLYIGGALTPRRWVILGSDGREQEQIFAESGQLTSSRLTKLFADGSYLFRTSTGTKLHLLDGSTVTPTVPEEFLSSHERIIKWPNHDWIVTDSIDLRGFESNGSQNISKNVSDYGVITIEALAELDYSPNQFLLTGSVGDTPSTYAKVALLVNADGSPADEFTRIEFQQSPPTQLQDGSWAHFEAGILRKFDSWGRLTQTVEISELISESNATISPNGWLYIAVQKTGIIRFNLQGLRDPDFAYHFLPIHSSFGHRLKFDRDHNPVLGVRYEGTNGPDESQVIRLRHDFRITDAPMILSGGGSGTVSPRASLSLSGLGIGSGPVSYQWLRLDRPEQNVLPAGPELKFDELAAEDLGVYQLRATSPQGTVLGDVVDIRPMSRTHLRNLSGRGKVDKHHDLVAGFVAEKWTREDMPPTRSSSRILLRGVGPTLLDFGVNSPLEDPVLFLKDQHSGETQSNDDWYELDVNTAHMLRAQGVFSLKPASADSQMINSIRAGVYTSTVRSKDGAEGIALAEIQTLIHTEDAELANLSLRGNVGIEENVLIGGFIITDPGGFDRPLRLLVRAVGPTLEDYDVQGVCRDPRLTLYNSAGEQIATNDDWEAGSSANIAAIASSLGAFELPAGSKDAALLIELPPGAYTGHVTDEAGDGGQALFEIYRIPPE